MPDQDGQPQAAPHSELASFGEELRREREIRGISLKEIADATKISKRFLEAIERNDHRTLPAPVFTRGFVREYAKYLGLSSDEIVNRYNYAAAGDDRIEKSTHLERLVAPPPPPPKEKPFRVSGIPPWYARIDRNVIITLIIVAALAGLGWWAVRHKREANAAAREEAAQTTATHAPLPKPAPVNATTASAPPATTSTSSATAADEVLHLNVEARARTWVVLEADGKTVFNDEMRKGDHATYDAKDRFRFRTIGNAGGINLTLNDVALPPFGGDGDVVHDRVVDRELLARQRAEPRPTP
ncbi:MAG TPA: RodZ domain-containing protein [Thermoanaerobaculia bacterium]|nr:RodZ domain-containing protein [Thermoanaerobaculia bacterium]